MVSTLGRKDSRARTPPSTSSLSGLELAADESRRTDELYSCSVRPRRIIFPLLFSESLTLYLLVLFQALSLLTPLARQVHWQLSLWILVGLLVVVVPAVQGWVLMRGTKSAFVFCLESRIALQLQDELTLCPISCGNRERKYDEDWAGSSSVLCDAGHVLPPSYPGTDAALLQLVQCVPLRCETVPQTPSY